MVGKQSYKYQKNFYCVLVYLPLFFTFVSKKVKYFSVQLNICLKGNRSVPSMGPSGTLTETSNYIEHDWKLHPKLIPLMYCLFEFCSLPFFKGKLLGQWPCRRGQWG